MDNQNNVNALLGFIILFMTAKFQTPPTEEEFTSVAEKIRKLNSELTPVTDAEFETIKKNLRENIVVRQDIGISLPDFSNGHKSWLPARRADTDFFFWNRYKRYLLYEKHWPLNVVLTLEKVSDEILDLCGDPKTDKFHIRGLMLGDVQSGKTSDYTAIANKAADLGYDLIIILAGIPELLRQQTQKRLDYEFCGRSSNLYLDPKYKLKNQWVGVGKYGHQKNIAVFTSEASDFRVRVLKSNNLSLDNVNCPVLLVVKKNKTILKNLYNWISVNNSVNENGQINKSLLIIDDEADNASINTSNSDINPTAINKAIRKLYQIFAKTTYLAVTATPFANIFIDPDSYDDLFPSDFIYALDPPSNYIGSNQIFSDYAEHKSMIEIINSDKFTGIFPEKHKKELYVQSLPDDLIEACEYFLLANAVRDCRGDVKTHRSMMIHISRFIDVQHQIAELVNGWLDQVKSDLNNYSKLPLQKSEQIKSIHALHLVWNKTGLDNKSNVSWEQILQNYLYRAVAPIDVREVNSKVGAILDYDAHQEDGFRVIAVGGNTLSRGLTLEGLLVSYFYRTTNMYDTLMQMGRWFGFRPNYDDLVKIWLSQDECDWYGQINEATQDLRDQIRTMKIAKQSPNEFGLKVRQDPGSLIVTAKAKMRNSAPIVCPINVSGHLLETPRLYASNEVLKENENAVRKFINHLSSGGVRVNDERSAKNYFWENVPSTFISELLNNFKTHPWHLSYNGKALAEYIGQENENWDVVLINTGNGEGYSNPLMCGNEFLTIKKTEVRKISVNDGIITISGHNLRVGTGGCAAIGLYPNKIKDIRKKYKEENNGRNAPDSAFLIKGRHPILMIHIIDAKYEKNDIGKYPKFLFCLGVGFPKNDSVNRTVNYVVNLVELRNWIDPNADEDE